jgi:hypothetical protein
LDDRGNKLDGYLDNDDDDDDDNDEDIEDTSDPIKLGKECLEQSSMTESDFS